MTDNTHIVDSTSGSEIQKFVEHTQTNSSMLTIVDGKPMADSRHIAEHFEKEHGKVLRAIEEMDCSDDFREANFGFSTYSVEGQRRSYPMCQMTRDGFTFLVMGFTGKKAAEWKEKYIAAFNQMENALKERDPMSPQYLEFIRRTDGITRMLSHKVTVIEGQVSAMAQAITAIAQVVTPPANGLYVYGKSSGQIWAEFNLPKLKNGAIWLGNRLAEMGCQIDNIRTAQVGTTKCRLFDPDKAAACMKNGLLLTAREYANDRLGIGQKTLQLVV